MNIWNKVLIGLICFLALIAAFWSAKIRNHYVKRGAEVASIEKNTKDALAEIEKLRHYDTGIPTLEVRNVALLTDRAENWRGCTPLGVGKSARNNKYASIMFSVKQNSATTMKVGDTIYVFDQRPVGRGGKYLGRFEVTQVQGHEVAADSLDVLTDGELQNLESSYREISFSAQATQSVPDDLEQGAGTGQSEAGQAAWSIFSRCPTDRPDLFKHPLFEHHPDKMEILPEEIRNLYQNPNFQPIDFGTVFNYYYQKRIENAALLAEKLMQQSEIKESNTLASKALKFCQNENDQLGKEIEQMKSQRQEVEELCKALDVICGQLKSKIQQTQRENERMLEEIQKRQRNALQKSDRTAAVSERESTK